LHVYEPNVLLSGVRRYESELWHGASGTSPRSRARPSSACGFALLRVTRSSVRGGQPQIV
jgi:hypothetical protein